MQHIHRLVTVIRRAALLGSCAFGAVLLVVSIANAGQCPADKTGANPLDDAAMMPKDVTDNILASTDLTAWQGIQGDRMFRLRRLEIKPGGIVPLHSHGDRPAIIYVVSGEVTEYASNCLVPIVHKAGEVSAESQQVSHWWKNTGGTPAMLLSADLLRDPSDADMM